MKRFVSLFLTLCLLLQAAPWACAVEPAAEEPVISAPAAEEPVPEPAVDELPAAEEEAPAAELLADTLDSGLTYTSDGAAITITGYTGTAANLVIPETIDGLPVTIIGSNAFKKNTTITSVTLPDTITEIGQYAFYFASNLASVNFPEGLTVIRSYAFDTTALTEVAFPSTLTTIGPWAFSDCNGLTKITLPDSLTTLYAGSFAYIEDPVTLYVPASLTTVDGSPFYSTTIGTVAFDENLQTIPARLFRASVWQGGLTIPGTISAMGEYAFAETTNLTSVTLPDGFTEIPQYAFYHSNELASISFPESIIVIRSNAFDTTALTSVTLPESLTTIGPWAFSACGNLETVVFHSRNATIGSNSFYGFAGQIYCYYLSEMTAYSIENDVDVRFLSETGSYERLHLDDSSTRYHANTDSIGMNSALTMSLSYAVADGTEPASVEFWIPSNVTFLESVTVDGETAAYSYSSQLLTVPVTASEGTIRFTVKLRSGSNLRSYARIRYANEEQELIHILNAPLPAVTLNAPERVDSAAFSVNGIAPAGASVTLSVNGTAQTTATANKAGSWSATLTVPAADDYTDYTLTAAVGSDTATATVTYVSATPVLERLLMYYNNHQDAIFDLTAETQKTPVIPFNPSYPFTFVATFSNPQSIEQVWITSTRNNVVRRMEAVWDETEKAFVAYGTFGNTGSYIPGVIGVEYTIKSQDVSMAATIEDMAQLQELAKDTAMMDRITVSEPYTETEDKPHEDLTLKEGRKATLDVSEAGDGSSTISMTLEYYTYEEGSSVSSFLNPTVDPASLLPGMLGMEVCYRSSTAPTSGVSTPVASGGWLRFTINDDDGNTYNVAYQSSDNDDFTDGLSHWSVIMENATTNEVIQAYIESDMKKHGKTEAEIWETLSGLDDIGLFFEYFGVALEHNQIMSDYDETVRRIYREVPPEQQEAALKEAKTVRAGRSDYLMGTVALGALGGYLGAAGMLSGPAGWAMAGILIGLTLGSKYLSKYSPDSLLGALFGADWIIDPSGYVYEGVTSNRLEGVTATAYWVDIGEADPTEANKPTDDQYGELWDGTAYNDQQNPLTTDADGRYAWDVPAGWWRVKYEKEGYETTWSQWLPVPPPQMDVNIGMVSTADPALEAVTAETDAVTVTFSQYMDPETVVLTLTDSSGKEIPCTVTWPEGETDLAGNDYAITYTLTPQSELADGSAVTVTVSGGTSHSGKTIAVKEMTAVVSGALALEVSGAAEVLSGGTAAVTITLRNAKGGETVTVTTSLPDILSVETSTVTVDDQGRAEVVLTGKLPGAAVVTLSVDGTTLTTTLQTRVVRELTKPAIGSASVTGGKLTATFSSDRAAILVAAVYSPEGQFLTMKQTEVSAGAAQTVRLSGLPEGEVKLFLVDQQWTPLCEMIPAQ